MKKSDTELMSVGHIEINATEFSALVNTNALAILPTRNLVLFPGVVYPINLIRQSSIDLAKQAEMTNTAIGVVCQLDPDVDNPDVGDLFEYGVIAQVVKVLELPNDTSLAIVRTTDRFSIVGEASQKALNCALTVCVNVCRETRMRLTDEVRAELELCDKMMRTLLQRTGSAGVLMNVEAQQQQISADHITALNNICTHAPIMPEEKRSLLAQSRLLNRQRALLTALMAQTELNDLNRKIEERARQKLTDRQRSVFLEQQLEEIRHELYGDDNDDAERFNQRLEKLTTLDDDTRKAIKREIGKLEKLNPQSPDYQTQATYLQTVLELPWGEYTTTETDFATAEKVLNTNHSGLEKVKERVLEQLAMIIHSPKSHAPIICLVGPPGVGKTSLGQSIATALGRKFQRVSLGGLHDESEIRGHRRTYIGAMPGRIIEAMRRAGSMNPVLMLDEIDKVGHDYKGDPAAALLEVLDPEQNAKFHDNYIDLDFDLGQVVFITTANTLSTISQPLIDRMEVINLSGYSLEEKVEIAMEHLIPEQVERLQLQDDPEMRITPEALSYIIENYTAESGVRQLQKQIAAVMRKYILAKMSGEKFELPVRPEHLRALLGVETMSRDRFGTDNMPGVVTGLAWTAAGGEILFIEALTTAGKGECKLSLTGNLGDVMKESATIAHRYVMAHARDFGIADEVLTGRDLHIHVPEGAIPKDGPSAGITMTTAIVSALTARPVRPHVAMTGEMTLRGKVLPVGGIKEKILAARRAGVTEIILSVENKRHIEEIKAEYISGLTFHYVTNVAEVINIALGDNHSWKDY
jgi:ATP-dependent Lon protease